jgi:hypothetical protein
MVREMTAAAFELHGRPRRLARWRRQSATRARRLHHVGLGVEHARG